MVKNTCLYSFGRGVETYSIICFAKVPFKSSRECQHSLSVLASRKLCTLQHLRPQEVDTGFVSVKGANVLDRFSSALAQQIPRLVTWGQPTLICKAFDTQLQWWRAAEAGCLGWVRFCSPLLFPISYASCFASFIHAPHLGIAHMPQHSDTPAVDTQFTKDKAKRREGVSVSSFQRCCNSFKITHFLFSCVSKRHHHPNLLRSPPFVAATSLLVAPPALLPTSRVYFGLFLLCLFLDRLFPLPAQLPLVRNKSMGNLLNPSLGWDSDTDTDHTRRQ